MCALRQCALLGVHLGWPAAQTQLVGGPVWAEPSVASTLLLQDLLPAQGAAVTQHPR